MRRTLGALRRFWPPRLAGQMIALLLLALILAQVVTFLIFMDERRFAVRTAERKQILERTASIVQLIESTPPALHEQIVRTASTGHLRFWLADQSAVRVSQAQNGADPLQERLLTLLDDGTPRQVLVELGDDDARGWSDHRDDAARGTRDGDEIGRARAGEVRMDAHHERRRDRWHHRRDPSSLLISARLEDGRWLNAGMGVRSSPPRWSQPYLLSMALTAISLSVIVVFMVRRLTRPMARLAAAAEKLGRGEAVERIPEAGPLDVR
ncbi:MAG: hypothetical protein ACREH6_03025, partial [Geminicoccaceae bacterium]